MKRFKNILTYVDSHAGNHPVLVRAVELARHNNAAIKLIDLVEPLTWEVRALFGGVDIEADLVDEIKTRLDALAGPIRATGQDAATKVLLDRGGFEIIREVLRGGHDLVMKMANGKVTRRESLLSELDMRLLRKCPCPVWLFNSSTPSRFERLLAAIDAAPDEDHTRLNKKILELATSLCASESAELHVAHVWSIPSEGRLRARMGDTEFQSVEYAARAILEDALGELLAQQATAVGPSNVHLLKGDPGSVIPQLADDQQIDLLVMGTVARTGVAGMFMGNTAESILRQMTCSVLAVKPDEFVSPVTLVE